MQIEGARVLVTAGSHRLGRAIAVGLAERGARVAFGYRSSQAAADSTLAALRELTPDAHAIHADVSDVAQARALVNQAAAALGGLDVLVNCASGGFVAKRPEAVDEALFDEAVGSTLKGGFFCAQAAHQAMGAAGGVIVNITDVAANEGWPAFVPHGAAKAGLAHLTVALARAWAPSVRVVSVAPGPVLLPERADAESERRSAAETLLGRLGSPDDIVRAVAYLIEADYVTGVELVVDGGHMHR